MDKGIDGNMPCVSAVPIYYIETYLWFLHRPAGDISIATVTTTKYTHTHTHMKASEGIPFLCCLLTVLSNPLQYLYC